MNQTADGRMTKPPLPPPDPLLTATNDDMPLVSLDTAVRCTADSFTGRCLDHQGHLGDHQHPQPEQETRP